MTNIIIILHPIKNALALLLRNLPCFIETVSTVNIYILSAPSDYNQAFNNTGINDPGDISF